MAERDFPRFTPPRLGQRDFARVASIPRWFVREAVVAFGLTSYDVSAFCTIADNLDAQGVSTTAMTLIAERGGMSETGAARAVNRLLADRLLYELNPRKKGFIMRYAIPLEMPWPGGGWQ